MSTLHLLSRSPFTDNSFNSCLAVLNAEDGLLLCGDAVYACQSPNLLTELEQLPSSVAIYALEEDLVSRSIKSQGRIQTISYPTFVQLTLTHSKVNSWL